MGRTVLIADMYVCWEGGSVRACVCDCVGVGVIVWV